MKLSEKINFRQPKYMLPAILYLPILFLGFFVIRLFGTEKADIDKSNLETTEFFNDKLPDANIKGDGIGDKYTNMLNDFGKIKDESAVENIERGGEDIKEEYTSQYSDAELAAMDQGSRQAQESMERLRQLQEQMRQQQAQDDNLSNDRTGGNTSEEDETLESLRRALDEARQQSQRQASGTVSSTDNRVGNETDTDHRSNDDVKGQVTVNEKAVTEIAEEAEDAFLFPESIDIGFQALITWMMDISPIKRSQSVERVRKMIEDLGLMDEFDDIADDDATILNGD